MSDPSAASDPEPLFLAPLNIRISDSTSEGWTTVGRNEMLAAAMHTFCGMTGQRFESVKFVFGSIHVTESHTPAAVCDALSATTHLATNLSRSWRWKTVIPLRCILPGFAGTASVPPTPRGPESSHRVRGGAKRRRRRQCLDVSWADLV